jgi:hypothetical protein
MQNEPNYGLTPHFIAAARSYGIPFLIGGGHAVIAHGFARSTFDIDLIARQTDRDKWLELAGNVGYELYRQNPNFVQFNAKAKAAFPLDLMFVNDATFAKMQAASVPSPCAWEGLRVVSLKHLLALKCHAVKFGHPGRIMKDAEDVIQLLRRNRLDPEAEDIREVFRSHGTDEFYEQVRKACAAG